MAVEQTPNGAFRHLDAVGLPDMIDQFGERTVSVLRQGHDLIGVRFKALGAMVAASRPRSNAARAPLLVVTRIDRLARSMRDLQTIVSMLKDKRAHLAATEQPVDTSTAAGKAFFDMLGVFAEFETNLRRERQADGINAAKRRGVYRGRPPKIDQEAIQDRLARGLSPTEIAREMGISRGTVYKAKALM